MNKFTDLRPIDFNYRSIKIIPIKWDEEHAERASDIGADAYGVYLEKTDGTDYWMQDFDTPIQAVRFSKFLISIAKNYKPDEKL